MGSAQANFLRDENMVVVINEGIRIKSPSVLHWVTKNNGLVDRLGGGRRNCMMTSKKCEEKWRGFAEKYVGWFCDYNGRMKWWFCTKSIKFR